VQRFYAERLFFASVDESAWQAKEGLSGINKNATVRCTVAFLLMM
jgi:hypothetical protein